MRRALTTQILYHFPSGGYGMTDSPMASIRKELIFACVKPLGGITLPRTQA